MRLFGVVFTLATLSTGILAQPDFIQRLPNCAAQCVSAILPTSSCPPTDFGCICTDANLTAALEDCCVATCSVIEVLKATNESNAVCGIKARDQSNTLIGLSASFGGLALIMVVMRLVDRYVSSFASLGFDDLLIGLSGLSSIGMNAPVIVAAVLGFGMDAWAMVPGNITQSLRWLYVAYFMFQIAECLCQLSLLAFYLRIMPQPSSRLAVWALIGIVTCFGIGNTLSMIFQCKPIPFFWHGWKGEMSGYCGVDTRLFGFVRGGIEIVLDLAILALPLPMLGKLNMTKQKKLQVMSMFCVGFVITVVGCLRLSAFVQFAATYNPTYDNTAGLYWCALEANLFIIVACMPALHAMFHRALRRARNGSSYATKGPYGSNGQYALPSKGSYVRQSSKVRENSMALGTIHKSTDINIMRTVRSSSDVELVEHIPSSNSL